MFPFDDGDLAHAAASAAASPARRRQERRAANAHSRTSLRAPHGIIEVLGSHRLFDVSIISSVLLLKSINSL